MYTSHTNSNLKPTHQTDNEGKNYTVNFQLFTTLAFCILKTDHFEDDDKGNKE